jgi:Transposase IS200 like
MRECRLVVASALLSPRNRPTRFGKQNISVLIRDRYGTWSPESQARRAELLSPPRERWEMLRYTIKALKGRHNHVSHVRQKPHPSRVQHKGSSTSISKDVQPELWSYMAGICRNQGMAPIAINGMSDHAHSLFHFPPIPFIKPGQPIELPPRRTRQLLDNAY